jgi:hypothetical protein
LPGRHIGDEPATHVTLSARRPRLHQAGTTCVTVAVRGTVVIVLAFTEGDTCYLSTIVRERM